MTTAAAILYIIGALAEIVGAVLGLLAYFALVESYTVACDYDRNGTIEAGTTGTWADEQECMNGETRAAEPGTFRCCC